MRGGRTLRSTRPDRGAAAPKVKQYTLPRGADLARGPSFRPRPRSSRSVPVAWSRRVVPNHTPSVAHCERSYRFATLVARCRRDRRRRRGPVSRRDHARSRTRARLSDRRALRRRRGQRGARVAARRGDGRAPRRGRVGHRGAPRVECDRTAQEPRDRGRELGYQHRCARRRTSIGFRPTRCAGCSMRFLAPASLKHSIAPWSTKSAAIPTPSGCRGWRAWPCAMSTAIGAADFEAGLLDSSEFH